MTIARREHRRRLPELSELVGLIDQARKLRLSVSALVHYPLLAEPAREAVEALQKTSAKLEAIADLVAGAKIRTRRRTRERRAESSKTPEENLHFEASPTEEGGREANRTV